MKVLEGSKMKQVDPVEFHNRRMAYNSLIVDIGTGEGEFVYKRARQNKESLYIGIDSSMASMRPSAVKSAKKPEKGGLDNVMYVVANAEDLPDDLASSANHIYIHLPWGSLRDGMIKGDGRLLANVKKIAKEKAIMEIYVGYCDLYEKKEMAVRGLPELNLAYFCNELKSVYEKYGICIGQVSVLDNEDLKKLDTKWAKKLGHGKKREIYYLRCIIN